jgi:hypothetical protein
MMRNGVAKRYIYREVLRRRLPLLEWARGHWHHFILFYIYNTILYCFTCIVYLFLFMKVSREFLLFVSHHYLFVPNGLRYAIICLSLDTQYLLC